MIIGIIGAMEKEVAILKEQMEISEVVEKASMTFCKGMLCGKEVVVVRSGIGKVNAAICAQILVDRFGVDLLINTGIAGSLNAAIDIGDIVISKDAVQHLGIRSVRFQTWMSWHFRQMKDLQSLRKKQMKKQIQIFIHLQGESPVEISLSQNRK